MRQTSFERGTEQHAFQTTADQGYYQPPVPSQHRQSPVSQQQNDPRAPPFRREFSQPAEKPAPLYARPAMPVDRRNSPSPPRSDVQPAQTSKPAPAVPFIRPFDIYKRMEEEREKERRSTESSRPSMDSATSRRTGLTEHEPGRVPDVPQIPKVPATTPAPNHLDLPSNLQSASSMSALQSIVDQAFERRDEPVLPDAAVPQDRGLETPQDVPNENAGMASSIDPNMSKTLNTNAPEMPVQTAISGVDRDITTSEPRPTVSRDNKQQDDEARAPAITTDRQISAQATPASLTHTSNNAAGSATLASAEAGGFSTPWVQSLVQGSSGHAVFSDRDPVMPASNFAEPHPDRTSHQPVTATTPAPTAPKPASRGGTPLASPTDGRISPFPGRVKGLAGKYNEIHDLSRRNSQLSIGSKGSFSSWSRSDDAFSFKRTRTGDSLAQAATDTEDQAYLSSPTRSEPDKERPVFNPQPSFRPQLPGQWISTADIKDNIPSESRATAPTVETVKPRTPTNATNPIDLDSTPRHVSSTGEQTSSGPSFANPVEALKSAGAALGASLLAVGESSHQTRDFAASQDQTAQNAPTDTSKRAVGDVLLKPLAFTPTASSAGSTPGPEPPAKDTPRVGAYQTKRDYFERPATSDSIHDSTVADDIVDTHAALEDEIVRSLTPHDTSARDEERTPGFSEAETAGHIQINEVSNSMPMVAQATGRASTSASHKARPDLLDQRFSWEDRTPGLFNPSALGPEVDLPHSDLRVVNTNNSAGPASSPATLKVGPEAQSSALVSPIAGEQDTSHQEPVSPVTTTESPSSPTTILSPAPVDKDAPLLRLDPRKAEDSVMNSANTSNQPSPKDPISTNTRIPPFRELMAIKGTSERIDAYVSTRQQFADMNTGLRDWLSATIAANPEHSHLSASGTNIIPGGPLSGSARHRTTPSFIKIAKNRVGSSQLDNMASPPSDGDSAARRASNTYSTPRSPPSSVNVEKMQSMGKDLLSTAGKLGGKGVVGAKGWLAKGKQRLRETSSSGGGGGGGEKVE